MDVDAQIERMVGLPRQTIIRAQVAELKVKVDALAEQMKRRSAAENSPATLAPSTRPPAAPTK